MERRLTSEARGERSDFQFKGKLRSIKWDGMGGSGVGSLPLVATRRREESPQSRPNGTTDINCSRIATLVLERDAAAVSLALMKSPIARPLDWRTKAALFRNAIPKLGIGGAPWFVRNYALYRIGLRSTWTIYVYLKPDMFLDSLVTNNK